jgi:hypothetical protein
MGEFKAEDFFKDKFTPEYGSPESGSFSVKASEEDIKKIQDRDKLTLRVIRAPMISFELHGDCNIKEYIYNPSLIFAESGTLSFAIRQNGSDKYSMIRINTNVEKGREATADDIAKLFPSGQLFKAFLKSFIKR